MKVVHLKDTPKVENSSKLFTGPVTQQSPLEHENSEFSVSWVHFPDGVRNKFHTHTSDQVLVVTEGKGAIATENEEVGIETGDVIHIPAGEKHWHGAKDGSPMTHITVLASDQKLTQVEE